MTALDYAVIALTVVAIVVITYKSAYYFGWIAGFEAYKRINDESWDRLINSRH